MSLSWFFSLLELLMVLLPATLTLSQSTLAPSQSTSTVYISTTTLDPTTTTSIVSIGPPTAVPSSDSYILIGCYNEISPDTGARALGLSGQYFRTDVPPDTMTGLLCLDGCAAELAPDGAGNYMYAALENSRECFCGLTLANDSKPVDTSYCRSPCAGDINNATSCGGFGYLSLYQLTSTILNFTTNSTDPNAFPIPIPIPVPTTFPTLSPTPTTLSKSLSNVGLWVGISLGLFFFVLLIALAVWYENRYYKSHHLKPDRNPAPLSPHHHTTFATLPFIGGSKFAKSDSVRKHQTSGPYQMNNGDNGDEERKFVSGGLGCGNTGWGGQGVGELSETTEKKGRQRRKSLEAWKSGAILPPPVIPPQETLSPVLLSETLSDSPHQDNMARIPRSISNLGPPLLVPPPNEARRRSEAQNNFMGDGGVLVDREIEGFRPGVSRLESDRSVNNNRFRPSISRLESDRTDSDPQRFRPDMSRLESDRSFNAVAFANIEHIVVDTNAGMVRPHAPHESWLEDNDAFVPIRGEIAELESPTSPTSSLVLAVRNSTTRGSMMSTSTASTRKSQFSENIDEDVGPSNERR